MTCAREFLLAAAALGGAGLAAAPRPTPAPWVINETASLPRGLYVRTGSPARPGAVVAVRPPATARAYLSQLSVPERARLLKRVVAGPGDAVCREGPTLTWPGGRAQAWRRDRRGRALPTWHGCRALAADEILVLGDSAASFDSRYFGPVRLAGVEGVYREAWRW